MSVIDLHPLIHASNGEQQTYQPAQKNPTGQAKKINTKNQMITQRAFIFVTDYYRVQLVSSKKKYLQIINTFQT